jgi:GAF domain-containing protein
VLPVSAPEAITVPDGGVLLITPFPAPQLRSVMRNIRQGIKILTGYLIQEFSHVVDKFSRSAKTLNKSGGDSTFPEIYEEDSLPLVSAKLNVAESMLSLSVKDCKFAEFINELLIVAMKVVPCEAGSFLELDASAQSLFFRATVGQNSENVAKFVIPVGKGIVGHVAESLQPYMESNPSENQMQLKSIDDVVGFTTRNIAAVPVVIRGKLFGVIELLNRIGDGGFSKEDLDLLAYCAEKSAKTIEIRLMFASAMTSGQQAA